MLEICLRSEGQLHGYYFVGEKGSIEKEGLPIQQSQVPSVLKLFSLSATLALGLDAGMFIAMESQLI